MGISMHDKWFALILKGSVPEVENRSGQGNSEGWENMDFDPVHGMTNPMSSTTMTIVSALDVRNKKGQHEGPSLWPGP
jgi:hypothetical protein